MRKTIKQQKQMEGIAEDVKIAIYNYWTCGLSVRRIASCTGYDVAVVEQVLRECVVYSEMEETITAIQAFNAKREAV